MIESIWTIPPGNGARSWIAEYAVDSDFGEWVAVWFPSEKHKERFWSALVRATATMAGPNPKASPFGA